jgi:hypothetical protein
VFAEGILADWMPAIHAGMTMICLLCSVGERKLTKHFVMRDFFSVKSVPQW